MREARVNVGNRFAEDDKGAGVCGLIITDVFLGALSCPPIISVTPTAEGAGIEEDASVVSTKREIDDLRQGTIVMAGIPVVGVAVIAFLIALPNDKPGF